MPQILLIRDLMDELENFSSFEGMSNDENYLKEKVSTHHDEAGRIMKNLNQDSQDSFLLYHFTNKKSF